MVINRRRYRKAGNADQRLTGRALQERNLVVKERAKYCCQSCGRPTAMGNVDHIKALENGGTDDIDNLQWLCIPCHDIKTRRDLGYKPKGVDVRGNPTDPNHHWNK